MIKPQDLRIGNWLIDGNGSYYQVEIPDLALLSQRPDTKECNPIELSAEILEKCGFKKDWNGYSLQNIRSVSFAITKDGELLACWLDRSLGFTINYLHQLQNLYFALTGEELPVKL